MTDNRTYTDLFTKTHKAEYWDRLYEQPSNLFEHLMVQRRDYAHRYVCAHFGAAARVLDLGCGAGVLSERLIESGYRVTCVDASDDMVELCGNRLGRFPRDTHTVLAANCLQLPFPDGHFDLVVTMGMFGYFDEVSQALREIRRVLRPEGTLLLSVRNPNNHYLFDLAELARLPVRLAGKLFRKAFKLRAREAPIKPSSAAPQGLSAPDDGFRIRMFQNPAPLISGVSQRGFRLVHFDGIGYGPPAIGERQLLPARAAVALSDFLNRFFRRTGLQRASRWLADVSFYVFTTRPNP